MECLRCHIFSPRKKIYCNLVTLFLLKMERSVVFLLCLMLCSASNNANEDRVEDLFQEGEGIELLTANRLEAEVHGDPQNNWVVIFYLRTCPFSKAFAPNFKTVAQELGDKVKFGAMNCLYENKPFCKANHALIAGNIPPSL